MQNKPVVNRRTFLETAGAATGAAVAAGSIAHPAIGAVKGANEKLKVGILGPGGRAQEHIRILNHLKDETKGAVEIVGLCDVWDGNDAIRRGLYHSAKKCGLDAEGKDKDRITKDYRRLLDNKDIDAVPDRHARPLARQDVHRRHGGRQGRLLRKADDPHDRRGPSGGRDGQADQAGLHRRRPVDGRPPLAAWPTS